MNAAVRMSVPIVSAQTVKQVHSEAPSSLSQQFCTQWHHSYGWACSFCSGFCMVLIIWNIYLYCLCTGCTQTLDVSSSGGDHQSDPPASHHASHTSATDPAQPHQPAAGHCARPRPRLWEHGLCCVAGPIRYAGPYVSWSRTDEFGCLLDSLTLLVSIDPPACVCDFDQQLHLLNSHSHTDSSQAFTQRVSRAPHASLLRVYQLHQKISLTLRLHSACALLQFINVRSNLKAEKTLQLHTVTVSEIVCSPAFVYFLWKLPI